MLLSTLLFLDFSGGEFLLIAVVFLMFFGSKSIPGMARAIGKGIREFREAANNVQREISDSVKVEEVKETKQTTATTIPQQTTPIVKPETEAKPTSEEPKL